MATGNFDGEIKDAMQSKSRMKPGGVPAKKKAATVSSPVRPSSPVKPTAVSKPPPSFPPKQQPAVPAQQPVPQQMPMPMPGMQPDAVGHAAGIAHAILAHGKGGMM